MDERLALVPLDSVRERERVVVHRALEPDVGPVRLAQPHDRLGNAAWHDHRGARAECPRRVGDALRVAARRRGDHAAFARGRTERRDLVEGATHLERPCRLEGLDLEMHVGAELVREEG